MIFNEKDYMRLMIDGFNNLPYLVKKINTDILKLIYLKLLLFLFKCSWT